MDFKKIRLSKKVTGHLIYLSGRTGLRPNILCRLGLCYSLSESGVPDSEEFDQEGMELNRYTLTGEWDDLFMSLLRQWCMDMDVKGPYKEQLTAHINRGILLLSNHVRDLKDIVLLIERVC